MFGCKEGALKTSTKEGKMIDHFKNNFFFFLKTRVCNQAFTFFRADFKMLSKGKH